MSQEDILKEKNKLEITLKPELIQFLRDKRIKKQKINKIQENNEISNNEVQDQSVKSTFIKKTIVEKISNKHDDSIKNNDNIMQIDDLKQNIPKSSKKLMEQAKEKGWIHMDSLEYEKLKWMEDIPAEKTNESASDEPYNARFDFNGKFSNINLFKKKKNKKCISIFLKYFCNIF